MNRNLNQLACLLFSVGLTACGGGSDSASDPTSPTGSISPEKSDFISCTGYLHVICAKEQVLYSFGSGLDAANPMGPLVLGNDGNFYGVTFNGGSANLGTVIRINPVTKIETLLYSFTGGADGANPLGGLVLGKDGNFYGTTYSGGAYVGTVFKISPTGIETVIHSFGNSNDGANPQSQLVADSNGNLYGTTAFGGSFGNGSVFKISTTGVEEVIYSFVGGDTDGSWPFSGLLIGSDGNLYGTTSEGGPENSGTVFKVTPGGVETVFHFFGSSTTDGAFPETGLTVGADGNYYGTTISGGAASMGTVFQINSATGAMNTIYSFASDSTGYNPITTLTLGNNGMLYGTAAGPSSGVLYQISTSGVETVLHTFAGGTIDGSNPYGQVIFGSNGILYGTTRLGGLNNQGTFYSYTFD